MLPDYVSAKNERKAVVGSKMSAHLKLLADLMGPYR